MALLILNKPFDYEIFCAISLTRDPEGVVVIDKTGFPKQGTHSAGVAPQYCGTLGKVGHCQVEVFLAYVGARGHTLLDRALYLPEAWTKDPARLQAVGLALDTPFATKPQQARHMLERGLAAGPPVAWVTGDTVYGRSRALRSWLENRGRHSCAGGAPQRGAVGRHRPLARGRGAGGPHAPGMAPDQCRRGQQGERGYDWQCWVLAEPEEADWGHYLLFRCSLANPDNWQGYVAFAPQGCDLEPLVAGSRCIEHAFEAAKQETGLDDYEVRSAHGWDRHVTLALWALALLTVVRAADLARPDPKKRVWKRTDWRPSDRRAAWPGAEPARDPASPVAPVVAGADPGPGDPGLVGLAAPSPVAGPGLPRPSPVPPTATSTTVVLGLPTGDADLSDLYPDRGAVSIEGRGCLDRHSTDG